MEIVKVSKPVFYSPAIKTRAATPEAIDAMAASIREVGMMNPITVTADHTLVAGLHRLEAAKRLGWTEMECAVP